MSKIEDDKKRCKVCKKYQEKWANKDTCVECFNKPKPKFYYDVRVECLLPATLTYKVLAETPEDAAKMIKNMTPNTVQHKLIGRKELKLMVFDAGCLMMKFMQNLMGR